MLSIDIGGTSIKSDVYDEKGNSHNIYREEKTQVNHKKLNNNIEFQISKIIEKYLDEKKLDGVSISTAGVVDPYEGKIIYSGYTIPGYTGVNLKQHVTTSFSIPCHVENDVNCMALGEYWLGAAQNSNNVLCLTVGTGIGGSVINEGKILRGYKHAMAEVGYMMVNGNKWQDIASAKFIENYFYSLTKKSNINGKKIFDLYDESDINSIKTINEFSANFGSGLLSLIYLLNPENIIIGGGIMNRFDILLPRIKNYIIENIEDEFFLPNNLKAAKLANEAGRIGAVYNFMNKEKVWRD